MVNKALTRILKLLVIFGNGFNGPKWAILYQMDQNGHFLPIKNRSYYLSKWHSWQVLTYALMVSAWKATNDKLRRRSRWGRYLKLRWIHLCIEVVNLFPVATILWVLLFFLTCIRHYTPDYAYDVMHSLLHRPLLFIYFTRNHKTNHIPSY